MKKFKISAFILGISILFILSKVIAQNSSGFATRSLNNLIAPTALNQHLLPGTSNAFNLGSPTKGWKDLYLTHTLYLNGAPFLHSNGITPTGVPSPSLPPYYPNTAVGAAALYNVAQGMANTAAGAYALYQLTTGNYNTATGVHALYSNSYGEYNTASGVFALNSNTFGSFNTAIGASALNRNTDGDHNTALGNEALYSNTNGDFNTASGNLALYWNTTGNFNTATGYKALYSNIEGYENTANGDYALYSNTYGSRNTANGYAALNGNTTGVVNTASGYAALYSNTTGSDNTASGHAALYSNTDGSGNTASGNLALYWNTTGNFNTATGLQALNFNTEGSENTASGYLALYWNRNGNFNTASGYKALYSNADGRGNMAIGSFADVTSPNLNNAVAIGTNAVVDETDKVRVGSTFVSSIGGQVGWSTFSDGKYKVNIQQDVHGLDFINNLRPITYTVDVKELNAHYNKNRKQLPEAADDKWAIEMKEGEERASKVVYNGFVAQEVEQAAKKLNYEFSGVDKPKSKDGVYGLRYGDFVVPLVKAVQELDAENKKLKAEITELRQLVLSMKNSTGTVNLPFGYLEQNTPNPASGNTIIQYYIPESSTSAQLTITNAKGQLFKTIHLSNKGSGQVNLNTNMLAARTYNYTLYVDGKQVNTKRLVITR